MVKTEQPRPCQSDFPAKALRQEAGQNTVTPHHIHLFSPLFKFQGSQNDPQMQKGYPASGKKIGYNIEFGLGKFLNKGNSIWSKKQARISTEALGSREVTLGKKVRNRSCVSRLRGWAWDQIMCKWKKQEDLVTG